MSSEPREYLIRKGGYYYRPNCSGYTSSKFEAGRYTKAEAEREAAVEPWHMSAIHQDDVEDDPVSSRVRMDSARIEALEAEVKQTPAAVREVIAKSLHAGHVILSPDEVRGIRAALRYAREGFTVAGSMPLSDADTVEAIDAAIRSLKGGRDAQ